MDRRRLGQLSPFSKVWSSSNGSEPFAWVPWGVYIDLPPRGTMVNQLGAGPSRRFLRLPASMLTCGARRLVGPADWSGTEPTGRTRRLRVLPAIDYCSRASNDAGLVMGSWLQPCYLAGDYCSHSPSRLVNGAWDPWEGQADSRGPAPYGSDWWRPCRLPDSH